MAYPRLLETSHRDSGPLRDHSFKIKNCVLDPSQFSNHFPVVPQDVGFHKTDDRRIGLQFIQRGEELADFGRDMAALQKGVFVEEFFVRIHGQEKNPGPQSKGRKMAGRRQSARLPSRFPHLPAGCRYSGQRDAV
jgi:hypothetical protein